MNRRKFVTHTPLAGAAALVGISSAKGERLYGAPGSVDPAEATMQQSLATVDPLLPSLFRLHTAIEGVPQSYSAERMAAVRVALSLVSDERKATAFLSNPQSYYEEMGLDYASLDTNSDEYGLIVALASPDVRDAAKKGDAPAFINAMSEMATAPSKTTGIYVNVNIVAAYTAIAAAVVFVVVVVGVAAAHSIVFQDHDVEMATALKGKQFGEDVASVKLRAVLRQTIDGIKAGTLDVTIPSMSKEQVVDNLVATLERHMIM